MKDNDGDDQTPLLARLAELGQPATLSTTIGAQRFVVTIKLPEKSFKTATSFVNDVNATLKSRIASTRGCDLAVELTLVDTERTRLQRATASFATFKDARTCLAFLGDLGLRVGAISAELEDFGTKKYDPWVERISRSWWPWLSKWTDPAPEMPMMKVTNRLNLTEGSKYAEGPGGKLGKSGEADRMEPPPPDQADDDERRREEPEEEPRPEKKKRRKKKD